MQFGNQPQACILDQAILRALAFIIYGQITYMAELLFYILAFTLFGSVAGLGGGLLILWKERIAKKISLWLVSFAAGVLLGVAFLDLIPEAFVSSESVMLYVLGGIVLFYMAEKSLLWYHCHDSDKCDIHTSSYLVILGDTVHNFIDGVVIAVSFLVNIPLGISTSIAVFFHEIPQEMGDFSILLHGGMPRRKVLFYNLLSALFALAGATLTYLFSSIIQPISALMVALVAGGFIYIATADLIPETHKNLRDSSLKQAASLLFGILVIWIVGLVFR